MSETPRADVPFHPGPVPSASWSALRRSPDARDFAVLGDNLDVLSSFRVGSPLDGQPLKADLIYIDPPYNVGGEQGYRNEWKGPSRSRYDWAGEHGAFLDFIAPRLELGRDLLSDTGLMMVSICDGEYCRLKILLDQIFGEENEIGTVVWNKNQGSATTHFTVVHEYVLIYSRDKKKAPPLRRAKPASTLILDKAAELQRSGTDYERAQRVFKRWIRQCANEGLIGSGEAPYCLLHPRTFRPFQATPSCAQDKEERRCHKALPHPLTGRPCKVPAKGWKWSEETLDRMARHDGPVVGDGFVIAGELCYGTDESGVPRKVQYLDEKRDQVLPSVLTVPYGGQRDLPAGVEFLTPKPVPFLKELIAAVPYKEAVVLDYFAGSGSTAQAVHELNAEDGGRRRWVLVEEMKRTFFDVLVPRLTGLTPRGEFSLFEAPSLADAAPAEAERRSA